MTSFVGPGWMVHSVQFSSFLHNSRRSSSVEDLETLILRSISLLRGDSHLCLNSSRFSNPNSVRPENAVVSDVVGDDAAGQSHACNFLSQIASHGPVRYGITALRMRWDGSAL